VFAITNATPVTISRVENLVNDAQQLIHPHPSNTEGITPYKQKTYIMLTQSQKITGIMLIKIELMRFFPQVTNSPGKRRQDFMFDPARKDQSPS
jgi:hypothetical protein